MHECSAAYAEGFRSKHAALLLQVKLNLKQDMYENQFDGWLEAIRTGNKDAVKCLYHDAAQTYKASWDITEASGAAPPGTDA